MPSTLSPVELGAIVATGYGMLACAGFLVESLADRASLRRAQVHLDTRIPEAEYRGRMQLARQRLRNCWLGFGLLLLALALSVGWGVAPQPVRAPLRLISLLTSAYILLVVVVVDVALTLNAIDRRRVRDAARAVLQGEASEE